MSDSNQPKAPLNIPSGNSQITPEPQPLKPEERLTGNKLQDFKSAFGRIKPKNDLENLGKMPCARNSLLYGIAGGTGIGAVRFLGSRRPWSAANWAVGSFLAITLFQWETCQRARRIELAQMKAIQDRYPHRHVSKLKKALGEDEAETRRPS
ncbi:hypothetical protein L202_00303 [Cryptococcus amylolentus CBS 6039]|uniref:Cytochrome c oxidase assembly protein COX20, mitochondrial n=1 Tax=Cryptococcus amylolentus CBS 6039 TaxID=1295533 RepID=A0A1E3I6R5_9TREE|nr:hypothetical protein L202_00303 [Cryptococcus amylolentus CBS 6039]ODN84329.1 hypothetical protein L202_00303 [Cryptococcus amylolentus CBS 6039]